MGLPLAACQCCTAHWRHMQGSGWNYVSSLGVCALAQVEKYRPTLVKDIVGNTEAVERLQIVSEEGNMPNIILAVRCSCGHHGGHPGTLVLRQRWHARAPCTVCSSGSQPLRNVTGLCQAMADTQTADPCSS